MDPRELRALGALRTPAGIQRALDAMPYHLASTAWCHDRTRPGWETTDGDLWFVAEHLVGVPHVRLLIRAMERRVGRVDRRSLDAGLVGFRAK